jgi:hypothetical protein
LFVFRWFSEDYGLFYVESRLTNYILRTSQTAVGDAGDAINSQFIVGRTLSNGMPFSSWDADNDKGSDNCAGINGGGWWYNYCASARLLGDSHGAYNGFMWWEMQTEAPGEGYALNACFMLVTAVD